jgi:outer membrane protein OmpA-like peptidoglycan-associated protein
VVYVTRDNLRKGRTAASKEGVVNLKITEGGLENGQWKLKGDFRWNNNEYSVGHPSVSKDGNVIYFASDMPGGYGKSDLYFSVFSNGNWSKPVNLGPKINTEGNEFFPFISPDGVLYFASDGHGGLGGLDIFLSVPEHGVFNTIENLGYPVNSPRDDFGLALDSTGVQGYFTSNREGGKGNDDLYSLKILHVPVIIRGVVKDRDTKDILSDARVTVSDENGNEIFKAITRVDGQFEVQVDKGRAFTVRVIKDLYTDAEKTIPTSSLRPNEEVFSEIFLERKIEEDSTDSLAPIRMEKENGEDLQIIELEYINYDLDKWNVRPDAAAVLDKLAELVKKYPDLEIRIESYTDSQGSDEYNMQLSKKRARGAFDYLVSKGIDPKRMEYQGFGESRLLNKCANGVPCTEEEHEVNRRSIVKVVRKGEYKERRDQKNIFYF